MIEWGGNVAAFQSIDPRLPPTVFTRYVDAFKVVAHDRAIEIASKGYVTTSGVSQGFYVDDDGSQSFEVMKEISFEIGKSQVGEMRALAKILTQLPREVRTEAALLRAKHRVELAAKPLERPRMYHEITTRRVKVETSGGVERPTVRVRDLQTNKKFTLATDMNMTIAAGHVLYHLADIRMRVRRRVDTMEIVDGTILDFRPVNEHVPTIEEAQAWFRRRFVGPS